MIMPAALSRKSITLRLVTFLTCCLSFAWIRSFIHSTMPSAVGSSVRPDLPLRGAEQLAAVLGGGPSSNAPLLLFEELSNVRFFGNPSQSYIFGGRDPQKTWLTLLDVAKKYKTYERLKEATRLYYRYIHFVAAFFEIDLDRAVDKSYNIAYAHVPTGLQETVVLYCRELNEFVPAKLEASGEVYLEELDGLEDLESSGDSLYRIQLQRTHDMAGREVVPNEDMDLEVKLDKDISLNVKEKHVVFSAGSYQFLYVPKLHAGLHYLSTFSAAWEDPKLFNQDDYRFVINRAGFEYPDYAGTRTMKGLNYNYANFIASVLVKVKSSLNELQQKLLSICHEYQESAKVAWEDLNEEECFVVVGAGRAAGEIARRLRDDFIHKMRGNGGRILARNDVVNQASFEAEETALREILSNSRKTVAVIDHHGIQLEDAEALKRLMSKTSYRDFLLEVVKSRKVPKFARESDKEFYTLLHSKVKALPDESKDAIAQGIEESLKLLLTKTPENDSYVLQVESGRDPAMWKGDPGMLLTKSGDPCGAAKVIQIGGSHQKGPQEMKKYALTRIHDSHYRKENLEFLEVVGSRTADNVLSQSRTASSDLLASLAKPSNAGWSRPSSL